MGCTCKKTPCVCGFYRLSIEQTVEKLRTATAHGYVVDPHDARALLRDALTALTEAQQEIDSWRERYLDKKRDFEKQAANWAKDQAEVARLTGENEELREALRRHVRDEVRGAHHD